MANSAESFHIFLKVNSWRLFFKKFWFQSFLLLPINWLLEPKTVNWICRYKYFFIKSKKNRFFSRFFSLSLNWKTSSSDITYDAVYPSNVIACIFFIHSCLPKDWINQRLSQSKDWMFCYFYGFHVLHHIMTSTKRNSLHN